MSLLYRFQQCGRVKNYVMWAPVGALFLFCTSGYHALRLCSGYCCCCATVTAHYFSKAVFYPNYPYSISLITLSNYGQYFLITRACTGLGECVVVSFPHFSFRITSTFRLPLSSRGGCGILSRPRGLRYLGGLYPGENVCGKFDVHKYLHLL